MDEVNGGQCALDQHRPVARLDVRSAAVTVLAASAGIVILHAAASLLVPVLLSVLLAYALEPVVVTLMRLRLPRGAAAAIVFMMLAIAVGAAARTTRDQINAFLADVPDIVTSFTHLTESPESARSPRLLERLQQFVRELHQTRLARSPEPPPDVVRVMPVKRLDVASLLQDLGRGALNVAVTAFAVALLAFLLLATGDVFKRKIVELAGPTFARRKITLDVIRTVDEQIARYLLVRLVIAAIVATATALPLWWLGLAHAFVWGLIAGAINVLPFIGPITGVVTITIAALAQFQSFEMTAAAGGIAAAVAALEGNLVTPSLTGHACELNTVAVFVSVLFWGWVWGMWGLLLAIPIMVAIKAAADHIEPLQPVAELLGR